MHSTTPLAPEGAGQHRSAHVPMCPYTIQHNKANLAMALPRREMQKQVASAPTEPPACIGLSCHASDGQVLHASITQATPRHRSSDADSCTVLLHIARPTAIRPPSPFRPRKQASPNRAAAYAMDRVAEPCAVQQHVRQ